MEPDERVVVDLYDELYDSLVECPLTQNKFLPLNVLQDVITVENIVRTPPFSGNYDLAEEVVRTAKKVLASLILVDCQNAIVDLLSEGLADEKLPLRDRGSRRGSGADTDLLSVCDGNQTFETFRNWKRADVKHFLEKQWLTQAPVFDNSGSHFILDRNCALPLQEDFEKLGTTDFSNVFKCELYQSHYQQDSQVQANQVHVVVKELVDRKTFEQEKATLTKTLNLKNRHLIKHIATCERGSDYYIIFPLADAGSLLDYWRRENEKPRSLELILWSLRQMHGLAGAIYSLHHGLGDDIHYSHGGLKPTKILLFDADSDPLLVIADFGVPRIYEWQRHMRRGRTTAKAATRSYEPPEASEPGQQNQPMARTHVDIWFLGCLFLEFAIWLLYDYNAIENFKENRKRHPENPHASFFQLTLDRKAMILPEVSDAIKALREDPRCQGSTSLESLVNLIADKLLVTAAEDRCKAEQLRDELQIIVQKARQDPSHLLNATDQPPQAPKVFLPVYTSKVW
ncbi:kinase-like domain-containing protein [Hyaloscypha finlandica]|nr:kinase-like domain-containing protein [Hyaloscypha finlandica]